MNREQEGRHDFSGSCSPGNLYVGATFSLGVFQWLKKANKKGLKKGKVKVRVIGFSHAPERVYSVASQIAKELDDGTYSGPKIINMKNCFGVLKDGKKKA